MKKTNTRGPQPTNFYAWVRRRVVKEDACVFLLDVGEKEPRKVRIGSKAVRPAVRTIEQLKPVRVEACNEELEVLGVWDFPENEEPETPGYAPEAGDTTEQRDLKVVAHLISDAYKTAINALENVVRIQNETFATERKGMGATVQGIERLIGKMQRTRFRVPADEGGRAEEGDGDDLIRDLVAQAIAAQAGVPMGAVHATANGAVPPDEGGDD